MAINPRVEKLMKTLDCTEQEALEVIEADKKIDRGEKLFELDPELAKGAKKARQADRKPTVYKFDTSKRKRAENVGKQALIETLKSAVEGVGATDIEITNKEREFFFVVDGVKYKIVMSVPRKQAQTLDKKRK